MSVNWSAIREEFPALANWTYLNTATFGQLPRAAVAAIHRHLAHRDELACSDFLSWFDDADRVRELVARLINCQAADVAFLNGANVALSLLIGGLDWRPGDRIVTLQDEFPNNLYYPALLERRGVEFVETPWERFYESITPRTRLVAVSTVNYSHGFAPPLEEMARYLRERGVLLFLDGTQSVGALRFDAGRIQPDMLAVHGYKWLLCPNGIGFMYVSPALRERLEPAVVGWRSHHDWRNVDHLHHGAPVFAASADKYEGGMLATSLLYAMRASLELMLEIGPEAIERRVRELATLTRDRLRGLGAQLPDCDSPIVSARWEGRDASLLARELKARRVLVSARHGNLRVSTHFYNHEEDIHRLATELRPLLP
ncbi:MAG: aminotransferase class V-fold PLP-dependent enzyme [Acidobacteria bacterium]|nr:aminotransferase class V-fold PLP-dependent enzyme [Acidobacteriota bacterium]